MSEDLWLFRTLSNLCDPVVSVDLDGNFRFINPSARKLFRCHHASCPYDHLHEGIGLVEGEGFSSLLGVLKSDVMGKNQSIHRNQGCLRVCDGSDVMVEFHASPIQTDKGELVGAVMLMRNISEKLRVEQELKESEEHLRQALQQKRETSIAIGILMERHAITSEQAFTILRKMARSERRKVVEVSTEIIAASELLTRVSQL